MSVKVMEPISSPPLKRAREMVTLLPNGSSKCAEMFVTNNADKWTLCCAYCPKATSDIGVFICHVRLEHLNVQPQTQQAVKMEGSVSTTVSSANLIRPLTITQSSGISFRQESDENQKHPQIREKIKEEVTADDNQENLKTGSKVSQIFDNTLLTKNESEDSENLVIANKNSTMTQNSREEINEEFFAITAIDQGSEQREHNEVVQVIYMNDEEVPAASHNNANTKRKNDIISEDRGENNDSDIPLSCFIGSEDDADCTQFAESNDNNADRSSKCRNIEKSNTNYDKHNICKCDICQKGFQSKTGLKLHSRDHKKNFTLKCPVCSRKRTDQCFITHVLSHESETCFPCQVCGKIFAKDRERIKHWETHAKEKPFYCKICKRRFPKRQYLTHHLKRHNKYQCYVCSTMFYSLHTQKPPFTCQECGDLNANRTDEAVITEMKLTDDIVVSENNTINLTNEDSNTNCSYSSNNNNDVVLNDDDSDLEIIDDHVPSSSNASASKTTKITNDENVDRVLYKCQYCNREFTSERGLISHISQIHEKNEKFLAQFICRYCNRTFQTRSGLALHKKTHDKRNQFHCPLCPLTEFRESSFITHVLMHESESCFPCQVCAKILPTNEERMEHWKTHLKERPHGCNLCYRRFYKRHVLKNHMKSHGLYYCHFCTDHINSVETLHPPYACSKCEKLPDIQRMVKQRKHPVPKNQVFDSDEED